MRLRPLVLWVRRFAIRFDYLEVSRSPDVPKQPWRPRPIRSWVLLAVFVLILIGGWCYYELQMAEIESLRTSGDAQAELEIAKMRLDTVRATLTVAAGIGAASALVLSFRRQQHDEYHSTQQRITELRMQAVEQLSSSDHTIRRGGLYNLERLGAQHEELRELVLDEICSYLRRPYDLETTSNLDPEREIRAFALEILERRLKRKLGTRNYWSHTRLDLQNAVLPYADFRDCKLRNADFTGVRFIGRSTFERAVLQGTTLFDNAVFEGAAEFARTVVEGNVFFDETVFRARADFGYAKVTEDAAFRRARFAEHADWTLAEFGRAEFNEALFEGSAAFEAAVFHGYTDFSQSEFRGATDFSSTRFDGRAMFVEVTCAGASFVDAAFHSVNFERATFTATVSFDTAMFKGHTVFRSTVCMVWTSFLRAHFHEAVEFEHSVFLGDVLLKGTRFRKMLSDQSLPGNYRPVEPRGRKFLHHWTVRQYDGSEPSAPHLAFGELGL
jgi:uncharacterized protein YjbI with pentapeptide repeats